jgi:hypothetical protein
MKTRGLCFLLLTIFIIAMRADVDPGRTGSAFFRDCLEAEKLLDGAAKLDDATAMSCVGYISGMADALMQWQISDSVRGLKVRKHACIPNDTVERGQLVRVVMKYMRDHPAELHHDRADIVVDAFRNAFPCK